MLSMSAFFDLVKQDLRYGLRMFVAKPAFAAVAMLSIALGIGATTAIFSVVYGVLIDPYPYRDANHIGQVFLTTKKNPRWRPNFTLAQYKELKARARSMEDATVMTRDEVVMTGTGLAQVICGQSRLTPSTSKMTAIGVGRFRAMNPFCGEPSGPISIPPTATTLLSYALSRKSAIASRPLKT